MATTNTLFDKARERFLTGSINWNTDTIKAVLVTSAYSLNASAHEYYADITPAAIVAGPVTLTSKAATSGAADAADITFTAVTAGVNVEAIVLYKDTGTPSTSPLIAYLGNPTGLPITGNGGDIIVVWDNGTNKIFRV